MERAATDSLLGRTSRITPLDPRDTSAPDDDASSDEYLVARTPILVSSVLLLSPDTGLSRGGVIKVHHSLFFNTTDPYQSSSHTRGGVTKLQRNCTTQWSMLHEQHLTSLLVREERKSLVSFISPKHV
jgi:hypothetical protein